MAQTEVQSIHERAQSGGTMWAPCSVELDGTSPPCHGVQDVLRLLSVVEGLVEPPPVLVVVTLAASSSLHSGRQGKREEQQS